MKSSPQDRWTKAFRGSEMPYPAEYVIRIFQGTYPRLNLDKAAFNGKKICEISCGEGRHLMFPKRQGFDVYATEIAQDIVDEVKANIPDTSISSHVTVGLNHSLPFPDAFFDYLLSWNACYYLGPDRDFDPHVDEFARVCKPNGYLILSIPKKSAFIYDGSDEYKPGYRIVRNDPFGVRNGETLRVFEDEHDIERSFSKHFTDFVFGSIQDDCFGFAYHWHLAVCRRRGRSRPPY